MKWSLKLDSNFNINQGMLIKAKILLEDKFGVPKTFFTTYGKAGQPAADITMYENKLRELQQQGFGISHPGIHIKHLRICDLVHMRKKIKNTSASSYVEKLGRFSTKKNI